MDFATFGLLAALGVAGVSAPEPQAAQTQSQPQARPQAAEPPASSTAAGATSALEPTVAPVAISGSDLWSMGQPRRFKWQVATLASGSRGIGVIGVGRDLANPLTGILGWKLEAFGGASAKGAEGGARALLTIPIARMHIGLDWDARTNTFERMMGFNVSLRRGGIFGGGSTLRIEWWSKHGQALHAGIQVPIGPRAGETRPQSDHITTPRPAPRSKPFDPVAAPLRSFRAAAEAVNTLVSPLHDRSGRDAAQAVASDVAAVRRIGPSDQVESDMARAWTQVFTAALAGGDTPAARSTVSAVTTLARQTVLDQVLIPYNALMGWRKRPDTLRSFTNQATESFGSQLAKMPSLDAAGRAAAANALAGVIDELDRVRDGIKDAWGEDRKVFVPLQFALASEDHDTQAEIDSLIERVTGSRFSNGNRIWYVINERFQFEFERTVRRAKRFHVLWIHDYRGKGDRGPVDLVGLQQTISYLDALAERARDYDATGVMPQYFVLLDEYFYESNAGRKWMTVLENPLGADVSLPSTYADSGRELQRARQALREAVAGSRALQAGRAKFGDQWLRSLVRVHVNITNPADWSFWANETVPIWGLPDNMFRDHRKIVFYDLSEDDPYAGEAMFTGMGIGEKYASAEWEDRALIVQGPAALRAKKAVRELLQHQGATADQMPPVFRDQPLAPDYEAKVEAETRRADAAGKVPPARAMQTHNEVGFGYKRVSITKLLLFSLLPPGSVVISPDSMWESHLYGSLLAGSALRGCRVLVITPATANSPVSSGQVQARTWMMTSRLLAFSKALDARITERGGLLKIGLFSEQSAVSNLPGRIRELRQRTSSAGPWMKALVPLPVSVADRWEARAAELARELPPSYMVPPEAGHRPKLHMKGVFVAGREAWDGWFSHPQFENVLLEYLRQRFRQVSGDRRAAIDVRELPDAVWPLRRQLMEAHEASQTPEQRARRLYYLQVGSFNMNNRSMLIDGEAALTVSGPAALSGLIDFLMVSGLSTWVDSQKDIDALIPPPSGMKAWSAHWMRNIL